MEFFKIYWGEKQIKQNDLASLFSGLKDMVFVRYLAGVLGALQDSVNANCCYHFSQNMLRNVGGSRRNKIPFPLLVGEADANIPNTGKNCSTKALQGQEAAGSQEREGLSLLLLGGGKVQTATTCRP